ncbi:MAG: hypothetical protein FWG91_09005 [Lachnospiraceae bacterium]|nr:hypothetical protein [Lachnospiraceae bacterium]
MSNRNPQLCAKAVRGFWNNERELIKQGQGTRNWSVQDQIEIMNFKPSGGERKNAAAPTYGQGEATEYGMSYDKYEGQHMKSAEAHPEFQGDPSNIQALTRGEHQKAHEGDFRNPTNGYYDYETGEISSFGDNPPTNLEPQQLSEAYVDTAEYQYILNSMEDQRGEMQNPAATQDVLGGFEQKKAEMLNPSQGSYENVLDGFEQRKAEMQEANVQGANAQGTNAQGANAQPQISNAAETGEAVGIDASGGMDSGGMEM